MQECGGNAKILTEINSGNMKINEQKLQKGNSEQILEFPTFPQKCSQSLEEFKSPSSEIFKTQLAKTTSNLF